jgi:hypothetical protein
VAGQKGSSVFRTDFARLRLNLFAAAFDFKRETNQTGARETGQPRSARFKPLNQRKPMLKKSLPLIVGLVLGSIGAAALISFSTAKEARKLYLTTVYERAMIAAEMQAGRQKEVLERLSKQLPDCAIVTRRFQGSHQPDELALNALWMIKTYYDAAGTPAPQSIEGILRTLPSPPPPRCEIQRQKILTGALPHPQTLHGR